MPAPAQILNACGRRREHWLGSGANVSSAALKNAHRRSPMRMGVNRPKRGPRRAVRNSGRTGQNRTEPRKSVGRNVGRECRSAKTPCAP